ncbi:MAG: Nif11-like leader peptide family natural product precursor [Cyanobacteria bacterium K_DeepCast_35m_m2_023]|nr:Nif11-like leader peptide family natural product precursor [Cyanobacteria bacterium K_DeepCast_35m_m2_023]
MSLAQLDAFVAAARQDPQLQNQLAQQLELSDFLALARGAGFAVDEADVIAAQVRAEQALSDEELQRRAGEEARKLRHFINA